MTQDERTKLLRDLSSALKRVHAFIDALIDEAPRRENVVTIETLIDLAKSEAIKLRKSFKD